MVVWPITSGKFITKDDQNQNSFEGSYCAYLGGPHMRTGVGEKAHWQKYI